MRPALLAELAARARRGELSCAARALPGHVCDGCVELDHVGERGLNQKGHDFLVLPLCASGHRHRHAGSEAFARKAIGGLTFETKHERMTWCRDRARAIIKDLGLEPLT